MRTSVPGRISPVVCRFGSAQQGFSLLEVMVVLLIIGVVASSAVLVGRGSATSRALREDARTLARLFTLAQAGARAGGRTILWQHDGQGHSFTILPGVLMLPAHMAARMPERPGDAHLGEILRRRSWQARAPVQINGVPADGLRFDGEWLAAPLLLELHAAGRHHRLQRLADGRFVLMP